MYQVGDVVYAMGTPDQFNRVFTYKRGKITWVDTADNEHVCARYLFAADSVLWSALEYELEVSEEDIIKAIRDRNSCVKDEELYGAHIRLKQTQELIDAWEGFDPKTVKIEMEEEHD